ncbi:hypothetical protein [Nitrosomonas communis]|uniref:Lipoprotein n=1 Tax=Nitrosomonas communis TaxID=44574 RepID=A0A1I4UG22_9PROT|nr:hypothetical protein [Nitrosomonas communis]SFM87929.1 hypothetical protein SAMN05421863_106418 [Nitrosomonas communis]
MIKKLTLLMIVIMLGFLVGCAQMNPIGNIQSNESYSANLRNIDPNNHNAIAKHYEDTANEMKAKLQEQKKLLEEYEGHSNAYGRRGQDRQSHITAKIRQYENSIKENLKEAAIHREMAQEEEKRELGFNK